MTLANSAHYNLNLFVRRFDDLSFSIVRFYLSHREQVRMSSLYFHVLSILGIIALTTGQEQLLMVFGGAFGEVPTLFPKYRDVHLLSLDGGPSLPWCLQSLNKFPREFGNLWESCPATLGTGKLPRMSSKKCFISYCSDHLINQTNFLTSAEGGMLDVILTYNPILVKRMV